MKKSTVIFWRISVAVAAIAVLFALLYGAFLLFLYFHEVKMNRVATEIIAPKAEVYIAETYPEDDFLIESAEYSFMRSSIKVEVGSESGEVSFVLEYDPESHELLRDYYESAQNRQSG